MKKKIAFFLMLIIVLAAAVLGMDKTLTNERVGLIEEYHTSVGAKIEETTDQIQNMLKLARKYSAENSQLEPLSQAIEKKIEELSVSPQTQAYPPALKELYALTDNLSAELEKTNLSEADQKYPNSLMVTILSLKDQIGHDSFNETAEEWNTKVEKFPASLLRSIKSGDALSLLFDYRDI